MSETRACTVEDAIEAKKYNKKYGKTIKVTNDFVKMMDEAIPCALKVLKKRQHDLEKWGKKEQDKFYEIMGVRGDVFIEHEFNICDMENKNTYSSTGKETTTVVEFMRKAVDRMLTIMSSLHVDSNRIEVSPEDPCAPELGPVPDKKVYKYGNFVNRTYTSEYSAYVKRTATWHCSPDQYSEKLEIHIGHNFCTKKLMGQESKVSTLCHEISHFYRVEPKKTLLADEQEKAKSRGEWGGVGTDDLPNTDDYKHKKGTGGKNIYIEYREKLRSQHSVDVFRNAYNFELYFQLTNQECEIEG
ncbi:MULTISPECIES: hypothetical protein [Enterobacterales]|uniref:hypothetical protein n=1 Tax=Enterobacterales TaxID=91347 RepID=UPI002EDAA22A